MSIIYACIGFHPVLKATEEQFGTGPAESRPLKTIRGYLDDAALTVTASRLKEVVDYMAPRLAERGLSWKRSKCKVLSMHRDARANFPNPPDGWERLPNTGMLKLLGVPYGHPDAVREQLMGKTLPRFAEVITKAAALREPHDAYLIVRDSSLAKVNHLYRTLSLSRPEVREFATAVDNLD